MRVDATEGGMQEPGGGIGMKAGVEVEGEMEVARHAAAMWAGTVLKSGIGWPEEVDA